MLKLKTFFVIMALVLSTTGFVFSQSGCIESLEDNIPELKGLVGDNELGPSRPKPEKPKIILDLGEKIH